MTVNNNPGQLQLSQRQLQEVRKILQQHIPAYSVWAFGSRVTGKARKYSDLDLVIITETPLPLAVKADLIAAFDEADLAFKVDIVDWAAISPEFRIIIERDKILIQKGQNLHNQPHAESTEYGRELKKVQSTENTEGTEEKT